MRAKLISLFVALATIACLGFVVGSASNASAAPASTASPYPPKTCPQLTVSTTTPFPGQTITVGGTNFTQGAAVTVELDTNVVLAHVTVGADKAFSVPVTLASDLAIGTHSISASGSGLGDCPVVPVQINVQGVGSSSGGGLASTGVDILTGLAIALALLAIGAFLTNSGRRRKTSNGRHTG